MMELGHQLLRPNPLPASKHQDRNHLRSMVISNTAELLIKKTLIANEDLINRRDNLNRIHLHLARIH